MAETTTGYGRAHQSSRDQPVSRGTRVLGERQRRRQEGRHHTWTAHERPRGSPSKKTPLKHRLNILSWHAVIAMQESVVVGVIKNKRDSHVNSTVAGLNLSVSTSEHRTSKSPIDQSQGFCRKCSVHITITDKSVNHLSMVYRVSHRCVRLGFPSFCTYVNLRNSWNIYNNAFYFIMNLGGPLTPRCRLRRFTPDARQRSIFYAVSISYFRQCPEVAFIN